jgi:hypothetical protein
MVVAFDAYRADPLLDALLNVVKHGERRGLAFGGDFGGIRDGFGGDFDLEEAVVAIDGLQGADVGGHQRLRVGAVAVKGIGGMHAEQILEGRGVEVVVAGHTDPLHAAAGPKLHPVDNDDLVGTGGLPVMIDFHVEVAQALEVVAQAAVALVEQVFVHSALLEDRNHVLDAFGG